MGLLLSGNLLAEDSDEGVSRDVTLTKPHITGPSSEPPG